VPREKYGYLLGMHSKQLNAFCLSDSKLPSAPAETKGITLKWSEIFQQNSKFCAQGLGISEFKQPFELTPRFEDSLYCMHCLQQFLLQVSGHPAAMFVGRSHSACVVLFSITRQKE
jgi:hypothetical protein